MVKLSMGIGGLLITIRVGDLAPIVHRGRWRIAGRTVTEAPILPSAPAAAFWWSLSSGHLMREALDLGAGRTAR
jgi:hypothetical protein